MRNPMAYGLKRDVSSSMTATRQLPVHAWPLLFLISSGSLGSLVATIGVSAWPWLAVGVVLIALGVIWVQAVRVGPEDQEVWMTKNTLSSRQRLIRPRLAPLLFTLEDIPFSWFDMPGGAAAVKAMLGQVRAWLARVRAGGGRMPGLLGRLFLKTVAYQESAPAETDIPGLFEADGFYRLLRDHILPLLAKKQVADPAQPLRWLSAGGVSVTHWGAPAHIKLIKMAARPPRPQPLACHALPLFFLMLPGMTGVPAAVILASSLALVAVGIAAVNAATTLRRAHQEAVAVHEKNKELKDDVPMVETRWGITEPVCPFAESYFRQAWDKHDWELVRMPFDRINFYLASHAEEAIPLATYGSDFSRDVCVLKKSVERLSGRRTAVILDAPILYDVIQGKRRLEGLIVRYGSPKAGKIDMYLYRPFRGGQLLSVIKNEVGISFLNNSSVKERLENIVNMPKDNKPLLRINERALVGNKLISLLKGMDYSTISCDLPVLNDVDLSGAKFYRTNLMDARLVDVSLQRANFKEASLRFIRMNRVSAIGADFSRIFMPQANVVDSDFSGINAFKGNFSHGIFENVNFSGADLRGADFSSAQLSRCDFTGAQLEGADFTHALIEDSQYTPFTGMMRLMLPAGRP